DWHEAVRASVEHAAAAVAEVTDAERAHRLVVEAQAVLQATTEADARRGLAVLQAEVTAAVRTARAAAGVVRRTDEILLRLGADSSPEARELRERAGEVRDEATLEQLRRDVEQVCAHRERQADRDFVLHQALESLRSLGYTVDAEPTPAVGEGVTVLAQRRGLSSHALQLTVLPERELLLTSVVALGDSTAQQDAAAEQRTCGDVQELAADMEGVRTRMVHHRPPGEVPVEHLSGAQRARRRARRATREHGAGR
ncbi:MAG TPA: hypothetical protein VIK12_00825, partial [Pengzhenrongella sp.]